jgi:hypothetical protein
MRFARAREVPHPDAARSWNPCPHCGQNHTALHLWSRKHGLGIGVPVVQLFTDRFTSTTHRDWFLICSVCHETHAISSEVAQALLSSGSQLRECQVCQAIVKKSEVQCPQCHIQLLPPHVTRDELRERAAARRTRLGLKADDAEDD